MRRMISIASGLFAATTFSVTVTAALADDTPSGRVGLLVVACTLTVCAVVVSAAAWAAPDMRAVGAAMRQAQRGQQPERTRLHSIR